MIIIRQSKREPGPATIHLDDAPRYGIRLDTVEVYIGEGWNTTIRVSWHHEPATVSMMDWIGLFDEDEQSSTQFLDYKVVGSPAGTILWTVTSTLMEKARGGRIVFRYFNGLSGEQRSSSPVIRVSKVPRILVTDLACHGLPPAHGPLTVAINTSRTEPSEKGDWRALDLDLPTVGCDELTVRVLELGTNLVFHGRVPVADFIGAARQDLSVAVRTPLLHRRIHGRQPLSVLLRYRLVPELADDPPPLPSVPPPCSPGPSRAASMQSMKSMNTSTVSSSPSPSSSSSGISSGSNNSNFSLIKEQQAGPLPEGWESRVDWHGRVFYIDHTNKRTTWTRPVPNEEERRTRTGTRDSRDSGTEMITSKIYHPSRRTVTHVEAESTEPVALRFLKRDDLMPLLHANQTALRIYNSSRVVKHMLHKIRKGANFSLALFEQNEDFVNFVNAFADTTQRLPEHFQACGEYPASRVVFVDHSTRQTTLLDPRLPIPSGGGATRGAHRRTRSAPPRQTALHDANGNSLLSEQLVAAVGRTNPELATRIKRKLRLLERWGEVGLARLANDVDIATAISIMESEEGKGEQPTSPEQEEFDEKVGHFYTSLQRSGYGAGPSKLRLRFARASLLHDAYDQILAADVTQLRKAKLSIAFDDEDGLDYGGPSRELFYLLSRELFNPYYGLFEYAAADRYLVQISPMSSFVDEHQSWMELAGRVLGLALVHRCLIDTFFTRTFYKQLLELPILLQDLETYDPEFAHSLRWMRENTVTEEHGFTFSVTQEIAGEVTEKELLPDGKELPVTDRNKEEFIQLMIKWRVERGVQRQMRALLRGLHQIIDRDFLRVFSVEQLELVLSGSVEIDLEDWQMWTEYKGGYTPTHVVIRWFWDTVEDMSNADRLKLLQFVTGTASVPYEGFRALRGSNGLKRFTIEKWGDDRSLPRAHTCFNRLDLPSYTSRSALRDKLTTAMHEGIAYAIE